MEPKFDLDKFIYRIDQEFGKSLILNSENCFSCFKQEEDRKLALVYLPFEHNGVQYDYLGIPLCHPCHEEISKTSIYDKTKIADAMEQFDFEILKE